MTTLDEMRRLAFIKYLYTVAVDQSQRPEPTKAAALLTFHDAVELFLYLAAQHLEVAEKKMELAGYFTVIKKKLPGGRMPREGKMIALNEARVGLKHYGNPPSAALIDEFRNDVATFLEENTPVVFDGLEFANISMVHLVKFDEAQSCLEKAQHHMQSERPKEAIEQIALAFECLLTKFEYPNWPDNVASPFDFGIPLYGAPVGIETQEALHRLGSAVRALSLGLDFRRYARFCQVVPDVGISAELSYEFYHKPFRTPSLEECRFCFDFVIDSALRLQEFDFDTK